jgi:RNA-binding protein
MDISSKQRAYLRKLAHDLSPVIMIGKYGLNEGLLKALDEALEDHELVKVKFIEFKEERQEMSRRAAEASKALLVTVIGNIAVLFRPSSDPEKQKIKLDLT